MKREVFPKKISRGKHTTRHVELFELESGGFVLDTPGFSSLEIENIKADDLWQYFPEMADSQNKCRFRGCSHINEPDCYIKRKSLKTEKWLSHDTTAILKYTIN